jgi:hypothetical protein
VPISIPLQIKSGQPHCREHLHRESSTFIPPHQLSQQEPSFLIKSSIPLSSSSKLRKRNIVLRSTGFLPTNSTEGFLVSRPLVGSQCSSGQLATAPSITGRTMRLGSQQQLSAAMLEPLQHMLSEQSTSGPLAIPAAIPECPINS